MPEEQRPMETGRGELSGAGTCRVANRQEADEPTELGYINIMHQKILGGGLFVSLTLEQLSGTDLPGAPASSSPGGLLVSTIILKTYYDI